MAVCRSGLVRRAPSQNRRGLYSPAIGRGSPAPQNFRVDGRESFARRNRAQARGRISPSILELATSFVVRRFALARIQPLSKSRFSLARKCRRRSTLLCHSVQSLPARLYFRAKRKGRRKASSTGLLLIILPSACQSSSVGEKERLSRYAAAARKLPRMRRRNAARSNRPR